MQAAALLYLCALSVAAAVVLVVGERDGRLVAGAEVAAFGMTRAARSLETVRFAHLSTTICAIDVGLLVVVAIAAARNRRPWTILSASLLIFPPLGHFAKMLDPSLWPGGYWLMTNLPALICLALLAVGARESIAGWRRRSSTSPPS